MKLRLLPLPFVLLGLIFGILGGWMRLGWQMEIAGTAYLHGLLMTGSFLGTLITLERTVSMPSTVWRVFPVGAALSSIAFLLGQKQLGISLLMFGNIGLLAVYFIQWQKHRDTYWYLLLAGGICWFIGNLMVARTGLVAAGTTWWTGFILLTIVGERLELTRYLNTSKWAKTLLWLLMAVLAIGIALPFHSGVGRTLMGISSILTGAWLMKYDMARVGIRKAGFHRYVATGLLVGYGWLFAHGLTVFLIPDSPLFYDMFLHTFFLGFAFSMIWAHAPIIFPAILKTTERPYHPVLWLIWVLFQLTLIGRIVVSWLGEITVRQWWAGANGAIILTMFLTMAIIMVYRLRR